jgi:hypothetical protein
LKLAETEEYGREPSDIGGIAGHCFIADRNVCFLNDPATAQNSNTGQRNWRNRFVDLLPGPLGHPATLAQVGVQKHRGGCW